VQKNVHAVFAEMQFIKEIPNLNTRDLLKVQKHNKKDHSLLCDQDYIQKITSLCIIPITALQSHNKPSFEGCYKTSKCPDREVK